MTKTGWQNSWVRIVTTLLTAAVMVMIFCFSMENAETSDQTSGVISEQIIKVIHPEYEQLAADEQQIIYDGAGTAYACSDEIHQLSIEGRSGQWTDVLVDGSGVLAGVTLGTLLIKSLNRKIFEAA